MTPMDPQAEVQCRELIRTRAWGGFDTPAEVAGRVSEWLADDEIDVGDADVPGWIDEAFADHREAQADWPAETDCDRLDATFATLQRQGVLCLQDAGYTQEDGQSEVAEAYVAAGGESSGIVGFCFYHGQDLERVVDGDDLFLAFGDVDGDETAGVAVGRRVRDALEADGFTVVWDNTLGERLAVTDLVWRRRRQG